MLYQQVEDLEAVEYQLASWGASNQAQGNLMQGKSGYFFLSVSHDGQA